MLYQLSYTHHGLLRTPEKQIQTIPESSRAEHGPGDVAGVSHPYSSVAAICCACCVEGPGAGTNKVCR